MFRALIEDKLRAAFALPAWEVDRITKSFGARHLHKVNGTHALSGLRSNRGETRAWYARAARLMPDMTFDVEEVRVSGWPWKSEAVVHWRSKATVAGKVSENAGTHTFHLKGASVKAVWITCDAAAMEADLRALSDAGMEEASMPPIGAPNS